MELHILRVGVCFQNVGNRGCCVKGSVLIVVSLPFLTRYRYGQLIEINSHSLFSKWFSEVSIEWFNY